ncbi:MAG: hypothetical protein ACYDCQ_06670 [Dehalococcoidia bacterium]
MSTRRQKHHVTQRLPRNDGADRRRRIRSAERSAHSPRTSKGAVKQRQAISAPPCQFYEAVERIDATEFKRL